MATLYTPKRVTALLGISASALRIYVDKYAEHLSTEATTTPRKFTEADLNALAFVVASTKEGKTHGEILAGWDEEYALFEWAPRGFPPQTPTEATGGEATALVPMAALQAAQALMLDAKRREEEAREQAIARERELLDQLHQLQREMGKAEGKIESLEAQLQQPAPRRKSPAWWVRLFGGGE